MDIKNLIATNIQKGLDYLLNDSVGETRNQLLLLQSRYNDLKRESRIGIINRDDADREKNKITYSLLQLADQYTVGDTSTNQSSNLNTMNFPFKNKLIDLVKTYRRRKPELSQAAQAILDKIRDYEDQKNNDSLFDISQRRKNKIEMDYNSLTTMIEEKRLDSLEDIVAQIQNLLADNVPSFKNIKKAYSLASGRGMQSDFIERQLELKPKDDESKIQMTEEIELFISKISVK